jgi:hypothetical protein
MKMTKTKTKTRLMLALTVGLATFASSCPARSAEQPEQALLEAIGNAKIGLQQGIAQIVKGTEVPTEAKFEMEDGKLMLSIYTSAKGFDTAAEANSFNEYSGEASTPWAPGKEVFADAAHIARSAQYHTLLSMTKITIPAIIQKASPQGTVFSAKEKVRNGKPVFEVMTARGGTVKVIAYDLVTGEPTGD